MTDGPRIRYWDNNYQEVPYCIQCGVPHPDNGKCLRRNKTQKDSDKNLPHPADMQSSLRDRIADVLAHDPVCNLKDDGYTAEDVLKIADAVIAGTPELHWVIRYAHTVSGVTDGKLDTSARRRKTSDATSETHRNTSKESETNHE